MGIDDEACAADAAWSSCVCVCVCVRAGRWPRLWEDTNGLNNLVDVLGSRNGDCGWVATAVGSREKPPPSCVEMFPRREGGTRGRTFVRWTELHVRGQSVRRGRVGWSEETLAVHSPRKAGGAPRCSRHVQSLGGCEVHPELSTSRRHLAGEESQSPGEIS